MESYVSFPVWIVLLANLLAISTYAIGAHILAGFGGILPLLYLAYCSQAVIGQVQTLPKKPPSEGYSSPPCNRPRPLRGKSYQRTPGRGVGRGA